MEYLVYPTATLISLGYAIFLSWLQKNLPEAEKYAMWLIVAIGCLYLLALSPFLIGLSNSIEMFFLFFFGGLPIMGRGVGNTISVFRKINAELKGSQDERPKAL